ncbi:hypothetical protein AAFF_G00291130 [Aldrovandia affinis]|uniref:Uncharacterized protein n=1 Tax=Aldrovandia affinis TaxID=143900 RepID=A0AAD7W1I7_9TELE|nr:hypothetical protein AAFF_G00291130 [Aldrovandia affinis]
MFLGHWTTQNGVAERFPKCLPAPESFWTGNRKGLWASARRTHGRAHDRPHFSQQKNGKSVLSFSPPLSHPPRLSRRRRLSTRRRTDMLGTFDCDGPVKEVGRRRGFCARPA